MKGPSILLLLGILQSCQTQQEHPIQKKPTTIASSAVQKIEPNK